MGDALKPPCGHLARPRGAYEEIDPFRRGVCLPATAQAKADDAKTDAQKTASEVKSDTKKTGKKAKKKAKKAKADADKKMDSATK